MLGTAVTGSMNEGLLELDVQGGRGCDEVLSGDGEVSALRKTHRKMG